MSCPYDGDCSQCHDSTDELICRCLGVTHDEVVGAVVSLGIRTVREVRTATGAGDGCTCCHRKIAAVIEIYSASPDILCAR
ncbi:MAG: (2Fe-2S)-binding protein [Zavarzinella sp.]